MPIDFKVEIVMSETEKNNIKKYEIFRFIINKRKYSIRSESSGEFGYSIYVYDEVLRKGT